MHFELETAKNYLFSCANEPRKRQKNKLFQYVFWIHLTARNLLMIFIRNAFLRIDSETSVGTSKSPGRAKKPQQLSQKDNAVRRPIQVRIFDAERRAKQYCSRPSGRQVHRTPSCFLPSARTRRLPQRNSRLSIPCFFIL